MKLQIAQVSALILNSVLALDYHNIDYIQAPQNNWGLGLTGVFGVEGGLTAVNHTAVCVGCLFCQKS